MKQSILIQARLLCVAFAISAVVIGCGGEGSTDLATPPGITNTTATVPSGFSFDGGPVGITVSVSGSETITNVYAVVTRPDGSNDPAPVAMTPGSDGMFAGTYTATANTREDGALEDYSVVVIATDSLGNSATSSAFHFQVPAPVPPVLPPPF